MAKSASPSGTPRSTLAGFSMVELVVSLCLMVILTAIAVPSLVRSLRAYQLNATAAGLSDMLKFTRFEAVRRNTPVNLQVQASGTAWVVWTDSINNGTLDPTEKQQLIQGFTTLLPSGAVPPPNAITAALGGAPTTLSGANNSVTFDARGAIRVGGTVSAKIFVFYIGSPNDSGQGFRAVILLPSGSTQIWSAPDGGPWNKIG